MGRLDLVEPLDHQAHNKTRMTKPLPPWSRNFEASSNTHLEVGSALSAAAGIALTFGSENNPMQYSWAIASVVVLLVGSCAAGIAIQRNGATSPLGRNIQIGTTIAILAVFLHNVFWEREINEMASKGWTLIYTFPAFLICLALSGSLAILFAVRFRRYGNHAGDSPTAQENRAAEQGGGGQAATRSEST